MKAIFTISIGNDYKKIAEITHPTIKAYADKLGVEFISLSEKDFTFNTNQPHWCKLQAFRNLLSKYDEVAYIDTDIIIRKDSPDIFKEANGKFAAFKESQFTDRTASFIQYMRMVEYPYIKDWKSSYYNTGVMVANKSHINVFSEPNSYVEHFYEQSYINLQLEFLKTDVHNLHYNFNRMTCMDNITGESRFSSYFIHYAGLSSGGVEFLTKLIKEDLAVWNDSKDFKFPKNIAVIVQGGMGDQIAAEPTVRYIKEVVYKGDNIVCVSDWPELFSHLDIPTYKPTDKVPNHMSYHQLQTLRNPEHVSWEYMSHPLVHCVDFASLQTLRCQLPMKYKQPQLPLNQKSLDKVRDLVGDVSNAVAIHPGRGWESKTFPSDVWQSYVNALIDNGNKVIVIGKRINEDQGIVEIDTKGCIDLVDKLNIEELIALVSIVPKLITNDSSPVHIAGAFDNYIGLIATCKSPEYILHYRNGSQSYKAVALERQKLYDDYNSQPTQVYGEKIDKCSDQRMRECLPTIEDIIKFANLE